MTDSTLQTAEQVATTLEQTALQLSPEIIAALAIASPQDAMVAQATVVAIQVLTAGVKQLILKQTTAAALTAKVMQTATGVEATHEAWAKFAAAEGVPEQPVPAA